MSETRPQKARQPSNNIFRESLKCAGRVGRMRRLDQGLVGSRAGKTNQAKLKRDQSNNIKTSPCPWPSVLDPVLIQRSYDPLSPREAARGPLGSAVPPPHPLPDEPHTPRPTRSHLQHPPSLAQPQQHPNVVTLSHVVSEERRHAIDCNLNWGNDQAGELAI